jgi:hypothetical protein
MIGIGISAGFVVHPALKICVGGVDILEVSSTTRAGLSGGSHSMR